MIDLDRNRLASATRPPPPRCRPGWSGGRPRPPERPSDPESWLATLPPGSRLIPGEDGSREGAGLFLVGGSAGAPPRVVVASLRRCTALYAMQYNAGGPGAV